MCSSEKLALTAQQLFAIELHEKSEYDIFIRFVACSIYRGVRHCFISIVAYNQEDPRGTTSTLERTEDILVFDEQYCATEIAMHPKRLARNTLFMCILFRNVQDPLVPTGTGQGSRMLRGSGACGNLSLYCVHF